MGYPIILKQLDYFMCNSWRENCCKKFKKIKVLAIRSQFIFYTSQTTKSRRLRFYQSTKQKKFARKNIYFLIFRTHSDDFLEIKKKPKWSLCVAKQNACKKNEDFYYSFDMPQSIRSPPNIPEFQRKRRWRNKTGKEN
jgi:hypothetical protein